MPNPISKWLEARRDWNRAHVSSWAGYTDVAAGPLSRFQALCEEAVVESLSTVGRTIDRRELLADPLGGFAIHAGVSSSALEIWIYTDGAQLTAEGTDLRLEEWDLLTPDELIAKFTAAILAKLGTL